MNQIETGKFIAKCRKEKKLTQAQLAEKLNITDRAVSKWETGKSMPDASIMLELCKILGITVNELLSGEKVNMDSLEKKADENLIALKRKDENNLAENVVISVLFSITLLIGIMVCGICNIAISGNLSWSLVPMASIVFAWVISFPSIMFGKKGIIKSLISLSVFVIPYIYLLSRILKVKELFQLGAAISLISLVFLWIIFAVFCRIGKTRKLVALGITALLIVPFVIIINVLLFKMIETPIFDVWDFMSIIILLMLAMVFFICDYAEKKGLLKRKSKKL
ncbi:MAG TPA: helix-turn-helix transcriptional regulator [Candidatus Scatavimonas merdigallinarum]|uniref:Helix-turn-helix transcriptional regulator n=1 Tax=Candidatus Scatavimonas merdigallinarum TaxID=2840914 RepID=A0A9D0ZIP4_9FIRM|nr:helix-turn-helix transcriptional regulator [Candidatus Scatavimonas merdigallinarum]